RHFFRDKPRGKRLHHPITKENQFLETEGSVLYWASSIHNLSNQFVRNYLDEHPNSAASKLQIPETRMVLGGLYLNGPDSKDGRAGMIILIEELIAAPEAAKGPHFLKFINNGLPVPKFSQGQAGLVSRFLAFSQHVQYVKMDKLAFVSDYQGSFTLLSDPQILTHPKLGSLFGEGNLGTAFLDFEKTHPCNEYCSAFGLEPFGPSANAGPSAMSGTKPGPLDLVEDHESLPTPEAAIDDVLTEQAGAKERTGDGEQPANEPANRQRQKQPAGKASLQTAGVPASPPPSKRRSERIEARKNAAASSRKTVG
ncbi:hypothetical protein CALVIDRAFT_568317, partial [Calocera viscosa TUFC12733]